MCSSSLAHTGIAGKGLHWLLCCKGKGLDIRRGTRTIGRARTCSSTMAMLTAPASHVSAARHCTAAPGRSSKNSKSVSHRLYAPSHRPCITRSAGQTSGRSQQHSSRTSRPSWRTSAASEPSVRVGLAVPAVRGPTDDKPDYAAIDSTPINKVVMALFRRKMVCTLPGDAMGRACGNITSYTLAIL